jgi:hypothetical protein
MANFGVSDSDDDAEHVSEDAGAVLGRRVSLESPLLETRSSDCATSIFPPA